jgi:hypothetical protein
MRLLPILAALSVSVVSGWDSSGHQLVASVAFQNLSPATKGKLLDLLRQHPKFSCWTAGIAPADQDQLLETAMREAAIWPDSIKALTTNAGGFPLPIPHCYSAVDRTGPTSYRSDGDRYKTDPQSVAAAQQNTGYADHLMHKYWHFDDLPLAPTDAIAKANPPQAINAVERIALFRDTLKSADASPQALQLKSYDAVWLIHIVGDVHQPLHCTARFLSADDKGDNGGNSVKITDHAGELHGFWDHLADHVLASKIAKPDAGTAAISDPAQWARGSFELAQKFAYKDPVGAGLGPFALSSRPQYQIDALTTANAQISLAGVRLAALLNSALK